MEDESEDGQFDSAAVKAICTKVRAQTGVQRPTLTAAPHRGSPNDPGNKTKR